MLRYKFVIKHYCPENTCTETPPIEELVYDPIVEHTIQLRGFYRIADELLKEGIKIRFPPVPIRKCLRRRSVKKVEIPVERKLPELPEFPEIPDNYPFHDDRILQSYKDKTPFKINFMGMLSDKECTEARIYFVKRVLNHIGFEEENLYVTERRSRKPIRILSMAVDAFLRQFIIIWKHKKFSEHFADSDDLWSPFESALWEIGIKGVDGLYRYYYDEVIGKHDKILSEANDVREKYDKLLNKTLIVDNDLDLPPKLKDRELDDHEYYDHMIV